MSLRQHVQAEGSPAPSGTYSQAVAAGGLLFLAGVGPHDPVTRDVVGDGIEEQTVQAVNNIRAVLLAAGCDLDHIVNTTAYLADLERDWSAFDAVYGSFFSPPYPARTAVGGTLKGMLVELAVVAMLPTAPAEAQGLATVDATQPLDGARSRS
jgi:2-iminobutanoate/2-iminopropanoate deaminase